MTSFCFFFFNDTATTEIYTLSLHDALPILSVDWKPIELFFWMKRAPMFDVMMMNIGDRKSTRLNSSHSQISYAVFCLKKKNVDWLALITLHLHLVCDMVGSRTPSPQCLWPI